MTCKGICDRYRATKPVGMGRYAAGQKRCQICDIFIQWMGLWCPCCGYRLRVKPRNARYKMIFKARTSKQGSSTTISNNDANSSLGEQELLEEEKEEMMETQIKELVDIVKRLK